MIKMIIAMIVILTVGCGGTSGLEWRDIPDRPDGAKCWMLTDGHPMISFVGVSCESRKD